MTVKSNSFHSKKNPTENLSNIINPFIEKYHCIFHRIRIWLRLREKNGSLMEKLQSARPEF